MMRTMTAPEFKAKCLDVMARIAGTGETLTITRRGKAVAKVIPAPRSGTPDGGGGFAGRKSRVQTHGRPADHRR
ncbi:type II toxin-antitoxin system Phd/YefM family antitoxin [Azospirillum halopraeferens]|uniref:type II toxin-antitoxin system Phd/YefM family antitoxin n=1 Tax=Azospirillum halopraeferens TaxID=34010 RepID=UPI000424C69C|nr:type II toxin-antitoxin system Phd/YefM family antitoxin [Azospirillum halopraeferens]